MKLPDYFMIGLGNPGAEYTQTRHNLGFMVVDRLAETQEGIWEKLPGQGLERVELELKGVGKQSQVDIENIDRLDEEQSVKKINLHLIKPQQFMNRSGESLASYWSYFWKKEWQAERLALTDRLWVVHDDLDIALGLYKIQFGTGPKQHNGLLSIYEALGTDKFWHVRVGVDGRKGVRNQLGQDYVLGGFLTEEMELLEGTIDRLLIELENRFIMK